MKKLVFLVVMAILVAGGAVTAMSGHSYAQVYEYPPPPVDPYSYPWVGPGTPWVYYNGDWFLNGILYYFFGPQYGWAPYYAYGPTYIVRPTNWYGPMWGAWYRGHPQYWERFESKYPYWRNHREDHRYDERFYEEHHHGQGGGWHKGFKEAASGKVHPEGRKPGPSKIAPHEGGKPGGAHVAPAKAKKEKGGAGGHEKGKAGKPEKAHGEEKPH